MDRSDAKSSAGDDDISVSSQDLDDSRSVGSDLQEIELVEEQELGTWVEKLRNSISIQDRSWRLRTYPKCFIGSEAVDALVKLTGESRENCIQTGQKMLQSGYFTHVAAEHAFEDAYLFYRFASDVSSECLNRLRIWQGPIVIPGEQIFDATKNMAVELSAFLLRLIIKIYENNAVKVADMDSKSILESADYAYFAQMTTQLQVVDLTPLSSSSRLPFWLNIFHTLILHATIKNGFSESALRPLEFYRCSYAIGAASGCEFSLLDIEHTMIRGKSSKPAGLGGQLLVPLFVRLASKSSRHLDWCLQDSDARFNFALSHLAASSPCIRVYTEENILSMLQQATTSFLESNIQVDVATASIQLPEILKWYMKDFSPDSSSKRQLAYKIMLCMRMGGKREQMRAILNDFATAKVQFIPFEWKFIFSAALD